jgi:hypothetical protein
MIDETRGLAAAAAIAEKPPKEKAKIPFITFTAPLGNIYYRIQPPVAYNGVLTVLSVLLIGRSTPGLDGHLVHYPVQHHARAVLKAIGVAGIDPLSWLAH